MSGYDIKSLENLVADFSENESGMKINMEIFSFVNQSLASAINKAHGTNGRSCNLNEDVIAGLIYLFSNCKKGYEDLYEQMYKNLSLYINRKNSLYSREVEYAWRDVLFLLKLDDFIIPKWTLFRTFEGSVIDFLYELLCVHSSRSALFVKIIDEFFARNKKYPEENDKISRDQRIDKEMVYMNVIFDMITYGKFYNNNLTEIYEDLSDYTYYVLFLNKAINVKTGSLKRTFSAFDYAFLKRFQYLFHSNSRFFSQELFVFNIKKVFEIRTNRIIEKFLLETGSNVNKENVFNEILNTFMSLFLLDNRLFLCVFGDRTITGIGAEAWCKKMISKSSVEDLAALIVNEEAEDLIRAQNSIYKTFNPDMKKEDKEAVLNVIHTVLDKKAGELTDNKKILNEIKRIKSTYTYET